MNEYDDGPSVCYLLHYALPYPGGNWPQHYLGWTVNLERRLWQHRSGRGAALPAVFAYLGVECEVARTWPGDWEQERRLKRRHNPKKLCPICTAQSRRAS